MRRALMVLALAVAILGWPFVLPESTQFYGVLGAVYALVALSLVVLCGWTGQISLGHAAFLGLGCYAGQKLLAGGVPLPLALVLVALLGAVVSLLLGVPSLRLRGVYLAIVTLAFGAACEHYLFELGSVRGFRSGIVPRASFLGLPTTSDRGLYYVALGVLALFMVVVANLRRTDTGRVLFAIRDAEEAAASLGVRIAPYKVGAFALSATMATVAGVLYGMLLQATPGPSQFGLLQSFFLLALPVVGGLGSLAGAVVGGLLLATAQPVVNVFEIRLFLASGLLLVLVTMSRTDGLTGAVTRLLRAGRSAARPGEAVHYGSFVPDELLAPPQRRPRIRVRPLDPLSPGTLLRLRLQRSTVGEA
jgi:branched-chain amino acid transport system permease protein